MLVNKKHGILGWKMLMKRRVLQPPKQRETKKKRKKNHPRKKRRRKRKRIKRRRIRKRRRRKIRKGSEVRVPFGETESSSLFQSK
jgi:hypothetical protein